MKDKILMLLVFVFIIIGTSGKAQEATETDQEAIPEKKIEVEIADEAAILFEDKRITISIAIKKAIEINQVIYIARYNAAMADTDYMKFNSKYSPLLNAQGGASSINNPELLYSSSGKKNDSVGASASLSKFFSTGTTVSAGVAHKYSKYDTGYGQNLNINNPEIFASIEQELLKNAFGYSDRRQEKIYKNDSQSQREMYIYNISVLAVEVLTDYWNVVIAQNHLDNSRVMLQETRKVRRIIAERVSLGLSEKFEINYWTSLEASSKASVKQAEQNYRNCMRKFFRAINVDRAISLQERVVLSDKLPAINSEAAIKAAFDKRADYLSAVRSLDNAKLSLQINENYALPSLKMSMSASTMDYNSDSSADAYSNTTGMKYGSYQAMLGMSYPLDDTGQMADQRNAGYIIEQAKQWLEMTRRVVKDDVTTSIENINTGHELYLGAKEARKQSELYYANMLTTMKRGRVAASSVRDALDSLIYSREMELQNLVAYNISLIAFEVSKNELLETYNIDINNYIPKKE